MTKKDFIAIARAVRIARLEGLPDAWSHVIVARLADACRADNPRFDEDKFRAACWIGTKGMRNQEVNTDPRFLKDMEY